MLKEHFSVAQSQQALIIILTWFVLTLLSVAIIKLCSGGKLQEKMWVRNHIIVCRRSNNDHVLLLQTDKVGKAFKYLEAALSLIESGIAMESESPALKSAYLVYSETEDLIK